MTEKKNTKIEELKGSAKEAVGKLTGNKEIQAEGAVEKTIAKTKSVTKDIKDSISGAIKGLGK